MRQGLVDLSKLTFTPPAQSSPAVAEPDTGSFYNHTFGGEEDVLLKFPNAIRTNKTKLVGGRHVRAVAGHVQLKAGETGSLMQVTETTRSITFEGMHFDGNLDNLDILDAGGSGAEPYVNRPDVYLQNCRFENILGSDATEHADLYQPQPAIGSLYVENFTGYSGYQGFFLPAQKPIKSVHLRRVNLGYLEASAEDPITYLLWLIANGKNAAYDTYLEEVYIQPRPGQTLHEHCVWPKAGIKNEAGELIGAEPVVVEGRNAIQFSAQARVHGYVFEGLPPGGDFVKPTDCGLGYVSPGHL